ncbi:MAG: hypothetical protein GX879_07185 [Bacteroidales bacterium]|nr:hypothetical protein [Bacteroidales bacterium]
MIININEILSDYELIDCGNSNKLERFGDKILIRPEPSAKSNPAKSFNEWINIADARFVETKNQNGYWEFYGEKFSDWEVNLSVNNENLKAKLQLSTFKHVGIFPEQVINWQFLLNRKLASNKKKQLLNLFAYTGISSLYAAIAGYNVVHIDSLKQVVERGKTMMHENNLDNIRWIVDDARDFVRREIKRGNKYDGIILDPPIIGKGGKNKLWKLENDLIPLLQDIKKLLAPKAFVIISLYASYINLEYLKNIADTQFAEMKIDICEEIIGKSKSGNFISHGFLLRLV